LNRVANETVALIGDASGSADAITGEGLAQSFRQAVALAASIENGKLSDYNKAHRLIARLPHAMASLMLTMDRWPAMEKHGMRALASDTSFFEELLAVHMGMESLPSFALRRTIAWMAHSFQSRLEHEEQCLQVKLAEMCAEPLFTIRPRICAFMSCSLSYVSRSHLRRNNLRRILGSCRYPRALA
jgi:hypothetical protein